MLFFLLLLLLVMLLLPLRVLEEAVAAAACRAATKAAATEALLQQHQSHPRRSFQLCTRPPSELRSASDEHTLKAPRAPPSSATAAVAGNDAGASAGVGLGFRV